MKRLYISSQPLPVGYIAAKNMYTQKKFQSGFALVMSLAIVATLLIGVVGFSITISQSLQQSRLLDRAVQASYGAESGIERSLFHIRQRGATADCNGGTCDSDGRCSNNAAQKCFIPALAMAQTGVNFNVTIRSEDATTLSLRPGDSVQVDLFSPLQLDRAGITGISITSDVNNVSLYGQFSNTTNVVGVPSVSCNDQRTVIRDYISIVDADGVGPFQTTITSLDGTSLLADCSYTFRLSLPLTSVQQTVMITLRAMSGEASVPIPSRLVVYSVGIAGNAQQQVRVTSPVRPPLSGLYDFVLFSQEEVIK